MAAIGWTTEVYVQNIQGIAQTKLAKYK